MEDECQSRQGRLTGSSEQVLLLVHHVVSAQQGPIFLLEWSLLVVCGLV